MTSAPPLRGKWEMLEGERFLGTPIYEDVMIGDDFWHLRSARPGASDNCSWESPSALTAATPVIRRPSIRSRHLSTTRRTVHAHGAIHTVSRRMKGATGQTPTAKLIEVRNTHTLSVAGGTRTHPSHRSSSWPDTGILVHPSEAPLTVKLCVSRAPQGN